MDISQPGLKFETSRTVKVRSFHI
uniref:Uncharacterized protein n=1 Tax=Anguilla anguilla TaxID=7936 RepID=A0A0E9ULT9_ANGAN